MTAVRSPRTLRPLTIATRPDTSDLATIGSTHELWGKIEDEYRLRELPLLTGWAIDIGAHIGAVTFALLADHPALRVIAVEPLAENIEVIRATAEANGFGDRLEIVQAAIATGKTATIGFDFAGNENLRNHRYIGNMELGVSGDHREVTVPAVSLSKIAKRRRVSLLKIDCEGCEWTALADPYVGKITYIIGEGHGLGWLERIHSLLDATHDVTVIDDRGGPGTFQAVRRADLRTTLGRRTLPWEPS